MKRSSSQPFILCIAGLVCVSFYCYSLHLQDAVIRTMANHNAHIQTNDNQLVKDLQHQVKKLERKLDTYMAFDSDPFLNNKITSQCRNVTNLSSYCYKPNPKDCSMGDMKLCLPDIQLNNCIVYDFGIREEPDFGVILSKPPFNCQVFAFDPSPITKTWFEHNKELQKLSNYRLFYYGGGAHDETMDLREYDWGQVSIYQYPASVINASNCHPDDGPYKGKCRFTKFGRQKIHPLPVRSIPSLMQELGHDRIDILKLDVEGSEYRMLETLIASGACRHVEQLTLEWHHFGWDIRYGHGSDPHLNVLHRLLLEECGLHQFALHSPTGWPSNEKMFADMELPLYYNLASFRRKVEYTS